DMTESRCQLPGAEATGRIHRHHRLGRAKGRGRHVVAVRLACDYPARLGVEAGEIRVFEHRVAPFDSVEDVFALDHEALVVRGELETACIGAARIDRAGIDQTRAVDAQLGTVAEANGIATARR